MSYTYSQNEYDKVKDLLDEIEKAHGEKDREIGELKTEIAELINKNKHCEEVIDSQLCQNCQALITLQK